MLQWPSVITTTRRLKTSRSAASVDKEIHDMWTFVTRSEPKLLATFEIAHADERVNARRE
jgi:hypothetical protein